MSIKVVIFDLDGVIVTTDDCHYKAWKRMADEEKLTFNKTINERLRGVSRMKSLEIILEYTDKTYSSAQKEELAGRKNEYYKKLLENLSTEDLLPGAYELIGGLKERGIKIAVGSSSKNTPIILEKVKLNHCFDAVADGNSIKKSKPDPEVFLLAAKLLKTNPNNCAVIEDAEAGIEAALAAGMKAVGVGSAYNCSKVHYRAKDLSYIKIDELLKNIEVDI
jgi:beta-phosphoglucomutase